MTQLTFRDYTPERTTHIDPEVVELIAAMDKYGLGKRHMNLWLKLSYPHTSAKQRSSFIRLVLEAPQDRDYDAAVRYHLNLDIETDGGVWGEFPEPGSGRIFDVFQSPRTSRWSVMPDASLATILASTRKVEFWRLGALLEALTPGCRRG